jgi:hypothetical protein
MLKTQDSLLGLHATTNPFKKQKTQKNSTSYAKTKSKILQDTHLLYFLPKPDKRIGFLQTKDSKGEGERCKPLL